MATADTQVCSKISWTAKSQVILVPTDPTPYKAIKNNHPLRDISAGNSGMTKRHYATFTNDGHKLLHTTVHWHIDSMLLTWVPDQHINDKGILNLVEPTHN